jgi:voltage-gated potassium channel Kch
MFRGSIEEDQDLIGDPREKEETVKERLRYLFADLKFAGAVFAIFLLVFGGSLIIHFLERGSGPQWTYLNCMYFCTVTLTTIGYGDLTPQTVGGKVFVMFFTTGGVGIIAYSLAIISHKFVETADLTRLLTRSVRKKRPRQKQTFEMNEIASNGSGRITTISGTVQRGYQYLFYKHRKIVIAFVIYLSMLIGGALTFGSLEEDKEGNKWGFFNGLYFCFVTMATIGYGDFSPRKSETKIFFIFYAFLGLGMLTFFLQTLGTEFIKELGKRARKKLRNNPSSITADIIVANISLQINEMDAAEQKSVLFGLKTLINRLENE